MKLALSLLVSLCWAPPARAELAWTLAESRSVLWLARLLAGVMVCLSASVLVKGARSLRLALRPLLHLAQQQQY